MTQIWNFSPLSLPLLQRVIEAASHQNTENQWTQKFGRKTSISNTKIVSPEAETAALTVETAPSPKEQQDNEVSLLYDDFFDSLQQEVRFDFVVKECCSNPDLYEKMAQNLPQNVVEKLFNLTFATEYVENSFLKGLILRFLPEYFKSNYSCICIDILTKTNEKYPDLFLELIQILLGEVSIPSQVLNNFVSTLNENDSTIFIEKLTNFNLSSDSFIHNLLTIYSVYKTSKKTEKIQNWICSNLVIHSKSCRSDKNYGRLFLAYLQTEKNLDNKVSKKLVECLEEHQSVFKRACVVIVKELRY